MKSELLTALVSLNLMFVFLAGLSKLLLRFPLMRAKTELRGQQILILTVLLVLLVLPFMPQGASFETPFRLDRVLAAPINASTPTQLTAVPVPSANSWWSEFRLQSSALELFGIFSLFWMLWAARGLWPQARYLRSIVRESFELRRVRRTRILTSPNTEVPFAFALFRNLWVVLPEAMICENANFRMAVTHELQHARQGDLGMNWLLLLGHFLCGWNPFFRLWHANYCELQEFACDDALLKNKKINVIDYGRCLVEVAQRAVFQKRSPACATGLFGMGDAQHLKRRINRMFRMNIKHHRFAFAALAMGASLMLTGAAYASRNLLQDQRVTMSEAQTWAQSLTVTPGFKVTLNAEVLEELNRFLSEPQARSFMDRALKRLENYRSMVEGEIQNYQAPIELMAMPIIESGYKNVPQAASGGLGAGIWQFIPRTARVFGLRVDSQVDERLNERKLTQAAMRYLLSNHLRFDSWELSILAFNIGESRVQEGIDTLGSRDAWTLIRNGYEGDSRYLAKVMAAILILNHPEVLD